eukprot:5417223-Ditylum_brightwellii.AAC.1
MDKQVPKGDALHQNRPNNRSKGEVCLAMEHGRSKVGPAPKDQNKPTVELANKQTTDICEYYKAKSYKQKLTCYTKMFKEEREIGAKKPKEILMSKGDWRELYTRIFKDDENKMHEEPKMPRARVPKGGMPTKDLVETKNFTTTQANIGTEGEICSV